MRGRRLRSGRPGGGDMMAPINIHECKRRRPPGTSQSHQSGAVSGSGAEPVQAEAYEVWCLLVGSLFRTFVPFDFVVSISNEVEMLFPRKSSPMLGSRLHGQEIVQTMLANCEAGTEVKAQALRTPTYHRHHEEYGVRDLGQLRSCVSKQRVRRC